MRLKNLTDRFGTAVAVLTVTLIMGLVVVTVSGVFYYYSLKRSDSLPDNGKSHKIWWRLELYGRKATGGVPELSWIELWRMSGQKGGFGLENIVQGVSAGGSLMNAYDTGDGRAAGKLIFRQRCVMCHGIDAVGGIGPPLNHPGLKHGDSDLSIYKVLKNGIPGTPMVSPDLSFVERWQVIGYLTDLMIHGSGTDANERTELKINVTSEQLRSAGSRPDEWLTYSGSLDGHRHTALKEINTSNVSQLRVRWIQQFDNSDPVVEATPLVVDGTIFITEPPSNVIALDARSGKQIWRYDRRVANNVYGCCGRLNRGLGVLGHTLFLVTVDDYLVALNANTGKMIWEDRVADYTDGYSMSGAPLVVDHSVIVGVAGGDFGIRGFLVSYDADTGEHQWRFNTIPGPGEPGHETWQNDAWRTGGGPTWVTGSYDPSLDLLYWGVGNPGSSYSGESRPGDNLFTNSVIALHAATGKLAWFFQFTPHDEHDWDSVQTPVLTEVLINSKKRKVICWANRNGFYYVLDRVTGEFLTGVPFVEQNWAKGLDSKGRPILTDASRASASGQLIRPSFIGGTNWQNTTFDEAKGLIFVHATEGAAVFTKASKFSPRDIEKRPFLSSYAYSEEPPIVVVRALDVATGVRKWEKTSPALSNDLPYSYSGLLSTDGGLVFGASGGYAYALDSDTGVEKWRVFLGGDTRAAPISFTVDGRQVIAVSAGRALFVLGL